MLPTLKKLLMRLKIDVPKEKVDELLKTEIKKLERENKKLKRKLNELEVKWNEHKECVERGKAMFQSLQIAINEYAQHENCGYY